MKNTLFKPGTLGIVFSLYFCIFLVSANIQKPRILVLHSYNKEYAWTRDVSVGIRRVLDNYPQYSIKWHYMDTKRHTSDNYKKIAGSAARSLIKRWEPHVVIAVDDNAQKLVVEKLRKDPSIDQESIHFVYSGVNAKREKYAYDVGPKNVTGILERLNLKEIETMIREILPEEKFPQVRVGFVTDNSTTSALVFNEVKTHFKDHSPMELLNPTKVDTFEEWKGAIKQADEQADILLFTNYHTITSAKESEKEKEVVKPKKLITWAMDNTTLPNIGGWGFFVEDGGMIAIGVSPFEHGEVAAKMAVEKIEWDQEKSAKESKSAMYYEKNKARRNQQFITYASESQMEKVCFKLPEVYEAFARATDNYYEKTTEIKSQNCN